MPHIFTMHGTAPGLDPDELLSKADLKHMLKIAEEQSKTSAAKDSIARDKKFKEEEWCPAYFGSFVEWLVEHFLRKFGHEPKFNITRPLMCAQDGAQYQDYGVDGHAETLKNLPKTNKSRTRDHIAGSRVYIQVKGSVSSRKEHQVNDGSRIANFIGNAATCAILDKCAYTARFVLVTTASGVNHHVNNMANNLLEVIAFDDLSSRINGDVDFLNQMRREIGLPEISTPVCPLDDDAP